MFICGCDRWQLEARKFPEEYSVTDCVPIRHNGPRVANKLWFCVDVTASLSCWMNIQAVNNN